jgi:hypothetical protein
MVELKENTIEALKKIQDTVKETGFYINRFEVLDNYNRNQIINLDIREIVGEGNEEEEGCA